MSVPKPHNSGPADRLRVGDLGRGGEVAAGLRGDRVWVNAYNGTGVTVDVSLDDARRLALGILAMIDPDVLG